MTDGEPRRPDDLLRAFRDAGQGHVFRWWDELDAAARERLLSQLRRIDLVQMARLADGARRGALGAALDGQVARPDFIPLSADAAQEAKRRAARELGEERIAAGAVAALTVAGGQGTRLGSEAPKALFPIAPVTGKSLLQMHAEQILATRRRYGAVVPWYIMTSDATHEPTRRFLNEHDCFGLGVGNVRCFQQRVLPALDHDFRIVMTAKDSILLSPNGHGGTLLALRETGVLEEMTSRGVEQISYFQVDNPLVRAVDPVFIGFHCRPNAEMSSKAIPKRDPGERVGAFVRIGGRLTVVEYSDLSPEQMRRRAPDGPLLYGLGSPAIHVISVAFVRRETEGGLRLPFHLVEKSSPFLDDSGRVVEPECNNIYKFETFIFDALRDAERSVIIEASRAEEFSPVKNAEGEDSVETCRRDLVARCARWLESADADVRRRDDGAPAMPLEISPLHALDVEELAGKTPKGLRVEEALYLGPDDRP